MKLLRRAFRVGDEGFVRLEPEHGEDMWFAYNLVCPGDEVTSSTTRKVTQDLSKDGSRTDTRKVTLSLTIRVATRDFDPQGQTLRLSGPTISESEHLKLGAYHTLTLEPHHPFKLAKGLWDGLAADELRRATTPEATADLACLLISDAVAHLVLVNRATTTLKAKVEAHLPAKRGAAAAGHGKALAAYLDKGYKEEVFLPHHAPGPAAAGAQVLAAVERHVNWEVVRCLVVGGPGFMNATFLQHLEERASAKGMRTLQQNRPRMMLVRASSAYLQALSEILSQDSVLAKIKDTAAAQEVIALRDFKRCLAKDDARAFYGPKTVAAAAELSAIDTLLVTDTLVRGLDPQERRHYARLIEGVKRAGGRVLVFSGAHSTGQDLDRLTGVAALLRYPLPALEEDDE